MKPITLLLCIMISSLSADIGHNISSNEKKISEKKALEKKISSSLEKIADEMKAHQKSINQLSGQIKSCKSDIKKLKKKSHIKSSELQKIDKIYKKLAKQEKIVGRKVVGILSKELSIEMIRGGVDRDNKQEFGTYETNIDNIIMNEILHTYTGLLKAKFKKTKAKYIKLNKSMDLVKSELSKLSNKVESLRHKKTDLDQLQTKQSSAIKALKQQKELYLTQLKRIRKEQNVLANTLQSLKVTQKRKQTQAQEANQLNVRQIGSSYQEGSITKYKGSKTIAPLKSYTLTQKFGNYTDPIYQMKIFNESVILEAKSNNAKVRNVLDGSIIYAEKTPVLDNVVIVKHKNNIHTIYAHLSKIAPTIKVGKRVKKGYILGRIQKALTFEVTQDTKHINPMQMIN